MKRRCLREIFHEMLIKLKWWHVLLLFALVITAFVYSLSKMEFTSRIYLLNFAICSYLFLMPNPTKINFLLPGDKISRKSQVLMKYKVIFWGNFLLFCMIYITNYILDDMTLLVCIKKIFLEGLPFYFTFYLCIIQTRFSKVLVSEYHRSQWLFIFPLLHFLLLYWIKGWWILIPTVILLAIILYMFRSHLVIHQYIEYDFEDIKKPYVM